MCCKTCAAFFCEIISGWWGRKCRFDGMPTGNPIPSGSVGHYVIQQQCWTTNCSSTAHQRQPDLDPTAGVITRRKIRYRTKWPGTRTVYDKSEPRPGQRGSIMLTNKPPNSIFLFGSTCSLVRYQRRRTIWIIETKWLGTIAVEIRPQCFIWLSPVVADVAKLSN